MSKTFTKIGKQISRAVRDGGPSLENNSMLRVIVQNAKAANMPKDNIERAIKKAAEKGTGSGYKDVVYEGYGPHGIAIVVETSTDNPTRTVANVRVILNRSGGSLGTSGSNEFLFERKCMFRIALTESMDAEELELELIDYGGDELDVDGEEIIIYGDFTNFGNLQKYFEENSIEIISADLERIPHNTKELTEEQQEEVSKILEKLEDDDDVINVFHTMG